METLLTEGMDFNFSFLGFLQRKLLWERIYRRIRKPSRGVISPTSFRNIDFTAYERLFQVQCASKMHRLTSAVRYLIACSLTLLGLFYGFGYLRAVTRTVYEYYKLQTARSALLTQEEVNLTEEVNRWKARALNAESKHSTQTLENYNESANRLAREAHTLASDVLDYQGDRMRNIPIRIMMAVPGGPEKMRRNEEDILHYNDQAIMDFLKKFGGEIESIMRRTKPYGLDTSQLQGHIANLNSIQMMRLIGDDLNDVAGQLDQRRLLTSRGTTEKAHCPSYYHSCP
jgi:23S rRNA maturation mini-RNase III